MSSAGLQAPIEAVVLDMDGLLIDTEPAWRVAEAAVFAGLGITLTDADLIESTGQPIEDLIPLWLTRRPVAALRQPGLTPAEITGLVTDQVIEHVQAKGEPMPGVRPAVALFRERGLALAIASSSPLRLIDAVCDRLGLGDIVVRCSAEAETHGKPAPDVYLTAARRLGVLPVSCLALEDSPHGVLSAKAAGMCCVAVPDPLLAGDSRYAAADLIVPSLTVLDASVLDRLREVRG